ncbi:unnamed protein product [Laminaria digitata]
MDGERHFVPAVLSCVVCVRVVCDVCDSEHAATITAFVLDAALALTAARRVESRRDHFLRHRLSPVSRKKTYVTRRGLSRLGGFGEGGVGLLRALPRQVPRLMDESIHY